MIQGSFCSKLNALLYDIDLILCVCYLFFLGGRPKFCQNVNASLRRNGQNEFQIPTVDRADLLTLHRTVFCFLLLSKLMIYLNNSKKIDPLPFVDK